MRSEITPHIGAPTRTPAVYAALRKPTCRDTSAAVDPGSNPVSHDGSNGSSEP